MVRVARDGNKEPLAFTPLSEPWNDNIYYFAVLNYKRSGRYTVSFVAEGPNLGMIEPHYS